MVLLTSLLTPWTTLVCQCRLLKSLAIQSPSHHITWHQIKSIFEINLTHNGKTTTRLKWFPCSIVYVFRSHSFNEMGHYAISRLRVRGCVGYFCVYDKECRHSNPVIYPPRNARDHVSQTTNQTTKIRMVPIYNLAMCDQYRRRTSTCCNISLLIELIGFWSKSEHRQTLDRKDHNGYTGSNSGRAQSAVN